MWFYFVFSYSKMADAERKTQTFLWLSFTILYSCSALWKSWALQSKTQERKWVLLTEEESKHWTSAFGNHKTSYLIFFFLIYFINNIACSCSHIQYLVFRDACQLICALFWHEKMLQINIFNLNINL